MMNDALRALPPVHEIADRLAASGAGSRASRALCAEAARVAIDEVRAELMAGAAGAAVGVAEEASGDVSERVLARASAWLAARLRPALTPVINATGVFLHTGLGRAPLAPEVAEALAAAAEGFAPVEIDMETGQRGRRAAIVEPLLSRLTGAEAATVVNNNAAALTLAIRAMVGDEQGGQGGRRDGGEIVVSRGELIEIGGAFRLPEIIEAAGARLREVGTTNRTRIADYERGIHAATCALLKAHPSNYRIEGFVEEASIAELARLGQARGVVTIHDIGSGVLNAEMAAWLGAGGAGGVGGAGGEGGEPVASESLSAGADLVLFSGDKLLGGPQCGVILGSRALIERIERHPLMRALRVDKLTLSALEATLRLHESGSAALPLRAMLAGVGGLGERAEALARALLEAGVRAEVVATEARFGAGSAPGASIASFAVAIAGGGEEEALAARLRRGSPRCVGRIEGGRVLLDLAGVFAWQDESLARAVIAAAGSAG
jgi:L-seryl-tRNA(Ser) seleniumtransferase